MREKVCLPTYHYRSPTPNHFIILCSLKCHLLWFLFFLIQIYLEQAEVKERAQPTCQHTRKSIQGAKQKVEGGETCKDISKVLADAREKAADLRGLCEGGK